MTDGAHVVIIAEWEDEAATSIRIQNVEKDGRSFIPVFTSRSMFEAATKDGPFDRRRDAAVHDER